MADVQMPESQPCQFNLTWLGKCGKPSTNGWCSQHEVLQCASCGQKAVHDCHAGVGGLMCGASLCGQCKHLGDRHVTQDVYNAALQEEIVEEKGREASRTSATQRMNEELDVPLNLFELLKGDLSRYQLERVYYLQLHHGLMGFFPAERNAEKREECEMALSTDVKLVIDLWRTLEPRDSRLCMQFAYVNQAVGVAYLWRESQWEQEVMTPLKLLDREKFEQLQRSEEKPFRWTFGLLGAGTTPQHFAWLIEQAMKEHRVAA